MGFSTDQYGTPEDYARQQASDAARASIRAEKNTAELVRLQKEANLQSTDKDFYYKEFLRTLPTVLDFTDSQIEKYNAILPPVPDKSKLKAKVEPKSQPSTQYTGTRKIHDDLFSGIFSDFDSLFPPFSR